MSDIPKGLFTYDVSNQGGGGGSSNADKRWQGGKGGSAKSESEDDTSREEVDTNNSILDSEDESEEETDLETVSIRPTFSVQGEGGVETILNLREWLKSPWAENE